MVVNKIVYIFAPLNQLNLSIMSPEQRAKDFAHWLIIHTEEVHTVGACRRYKGITYNVDELYDKWVEFKNERKQKY